MKTAKDLSWLSAPAFFLILGMLAVNTKKQNAHNLQPVKVKSVISAVTIQKPA